MKIRTHNPFPNKSSSANLGTPTIQGSTRAPACISRRPRRLSSKQSAIALVITLLMLSVITFLAVAFLVLTRTHRDSVTATLDVQHAKAASQAALARAQSEIGRAHV